MLRSHEPQGRDTLLGRLLRRVWRWAGIGTLVFAAGLAPYAPPPPPPPPPRIEARAEEGEDESDDEVP